MRGMSSIDPPDDAKIPLVRRNVIYGEILKWGLIEIRNAAHDHDSAFCAIESDHLHNVPSYIIDGDQAHHLYYLTVEIPVYLSRVKPRTDARRWLVRRYIELWKELEHVVPIDGSPYKARWLAEKANGWIYDYDQDSK